MGRGKKLIRGSAVRTASFVISTAVSFFLMPFLVHELGDKMYGIWTLVGTFIGYFGLMDIGLSSAVSRFISRAVGRKDPEDMKRVISTSFYLFLALGVGAAVLTMVLLAAVPHLVKTPENIDLIRFLLFLLAISTIFDFPVRVFNSVITSNLREDIGSGIAIGKTIFCTFLIVIAIRMGYGIIGLAVVSFLFSILDELARVYVSYRIDPHTTIHPSYFDFKKFRPLFHYSFFALIGRLANIFRFGLDQLIITRFIGLGAVTHYFVATRLIEHITVLISQMIGVMMPLFSQDEGANDFSGIRRNFLLSSKISHYAALFCCGLAFLYGPPFIERWMGPGYKDSTVVLFIFLVPMTLQLMQAPSIPLLDGISKLNYYVYPNLIEGFINLALSLWLVQTHGIYGVALGTAIPMTLKLTTIQPWLVNRAINLNFASYGAQMFKSAIVGVALLLAGWASVRRYIEADYAAIVIGCFVQSVIYWPFAIWFGFTADERQRLFPIIKEALPFSHKLWNAFRVLGATIK